MLNIISSEALQKSYPGAVIGLLELEGVDNSLFSEQLERRKRQTEVALRRQYQGFTRVDFLALPVMAAYERYYKRFDKTYQVLLQVESLVLKGKGLPVVSALVDANFTAEVETLVLSAGHDAAKLEGQILVDISRQGDRMTLMNGTTRVIRPGDMVMRDNKGICCSIIYGQDSRSPISTGTRHVLYVSYAPDGVPMESIVGQLRKIEENIRLFSQSAIIVQQQVLKV